MLEDIQKRWDEMPSVAMRRTMLDVMPSVGMRRTILEEKPSGGMRRAILEGMHIVGARCPALG